MSFQNHDFYHTNPLESYRDRDQEFEYDKEVENRENEAIHQSSMKLDWNSTDSIIEHISTAWEKMSREFDEIGLSTQDTRTRHKELIRGLIEQMNKSVENAQTEKTELKVSCILLQKNIFKILRVFSRKGYRPSSRRSSNEEESEVSDDTYTEINQIFTNEEEFNDIMKAISDKSTKEYLLQRISPPYNDAHSYLLLISKILSKEYFSRLLKFLRTALHLKELADEIDFYSNENQNVDESSINFANSLPSTDQCETCIRLLERVLNANPQIDAIYKVVKNILDSNNFNNLSKTYLNRIQYQIQLVECEKERKFDMAIEKANQIVDLWRVLYGFNDSDSSDYESSQFDSKIIKCSEGDVASIGLNTSSFKHLDAIYGKLVQERTSREEKVEQLLRKCKDIFELLKEPSENIEEFYQRFGNTSSLSSQKIQTLQDELENLQEKKKYLMKDIITFVKVDIEKLWQKLFYAEEEKNRLKSYYTNEFNDQVLGELETELYKLQDLSAKFGSMFDKVGEFNVLLADKQALDEAARNPSRLLARNSAAILLKEEKLRKNIKRRFPKVCADLKSLLDQYGEATLSICKNEDYYYLIQQLDVETSNGNNADRLRKTSPMRKAVSPVKSTNSNNDNNNADRLRKPSPVRKASPTRRISPVKNIAAAQLNTRLGSIRSNRQVQSAIRKPVRPVSTLPTSFSVSRAQARKNYFDSSSRGDYFNIEEDSPTNRHKVAKINKKIENAKKAQLAASNVPRLVFNNNSDLRKPLIEIDLSKKRNSQSSNISPLRAKSPSVQYSLPLKPFPFNRLGSLPTMKRRKVSEEAEQENQPPAESNLSPDNIFLMGENQKPSPKSNVHAANSNPSNKLLNAQSANTNLEALKIRDAEKLARLDYRDVEDVLSFGNGQPRKNNANLAQTLLTDSAVFNDSMGDDSMYKSWKNKKLERLKLRNFLPDKGL